jgi:cytochrome b561
MVLRLSFTPRRSSRIYLPAALLALAAPVSAAEWQVDPATSTIAFSGVHAGRDFTGRFETWSAAIRFDPADLATAEAVVTVETGSAKTGDRTYDSSIPQEEWLNAKAFPQAVFEARRFRALGGERYEAEGTLTIKAVALPVTLPFTLTIDGATAKMQGTATLDRIARQIGIKSDPAAEWVSKDIAVTVSLNATRAP